MAFRASTTATPWFVGHNGATNVTRYEAQQFARQMVESQAYRDALQARLLSGKLNPLMESMLWHYAYGKPIEQINLNLAQQQEDLSSLSLQELQSRARDLAAKLEEAEALEAALPATVTKGPW